MKKFGIVATLFAITFVLSLENIKTDSYLEFARIKFTELSGIHTSSFVTKITWVFKKLKLLAQ